MLCENCGMTQATFHIKQIINGDCHEKHLCEKCARGYNKEKLSIFNVDICDEFCECNLLQDEMSNALIGGFMQDMVHTIFDDRFNAHQYNLRQSNNILEQAKNSILSGAKKQEQIYADNPNIKKIEKLEIDLKEAVDNENYEKVVEIKKEIDKLKEQGNV